MSDLQRNLKISFCTVCMDRLANLEETLPVNIRDNLEYGDLEFLILDYNSSDGLEIYVKNNFNTFIENGKVVYYRTSTPSYFNRSHSRNLAFKLASGDIVCNVDADNFLGKGFATYLGQVFINNPNVFLTALKDGLIINSDLMGRLCLRKSDFISVKGYDEKMVNYGFEDYDLINRLNLKGLVNKPIKNEYLQALKHGDNERIYNEFPYKNLDALFIRYISPVKSEFLFLFKDGTSSRATIINNYQIDSDIIRESWRAKPAYEFSLSETYWNLGKWRLLSNVLMIAEDLRNFNFISEISGNLLLERNDAQKPYEYKKIWDESIIIQAVMFYSQLLNRVIMEDNVRNGIVVVNASFGKDTVFKNFDNGTPIIQT